MKSIKPGRGPSFLGGIVAAAVAVFGIFWTIIAASMNAPVFFPIFGVVFVLIGIIQAAYNFKNATSKNRYSAFDITDGQEEPDPLDPHVTERGGNVSSDTFFCPYCGAKMAGDWVFCKKCGKKH